MKINEVETLLQISKANIRFYEKEGLLTPKRGENGYRDYSEADVEQLKKIIILRKLGVAIPDMRELFAGRTDLEQVLETNLQRLTEQLAEINGAINLCEEMQKDAQVDVHLEDDYYWNRMNEQQTKGERFVDIVSDYLEFEKRSWLAMWSGPFLLPVEGLMQKKGWLVGMAVLLLICVIRGIVQEVTHTGSFLNGFGYPFFLFAIITLCTFPLYVLDRKYRNVETAKDNEKELKKWQKVLKVLGALLYLPVVFWGGLIFAGRYIMGTLLCDTPYVVVSKLWALYFIVAMYLFCLLIWLYSKNGAFGNLIKGEEGFKAHLPGKIKTRILLVSIGVYLAVLLLYSFCFTAFTEDGVIDRVLWHTKTYTWEDVDYYTLEASFNGYLRYVIVMKDGFRADCLGGDVSDTSLPEDRYPDDTESYVKMLTEKFNEMGIPLEVDNWERMEKKLDYDYWRDFAEELRKMAE